MQQKPHGKDLRKGRFSEPDRIYLITTVTQNRKRIFEDFYIARSLVAILRQEQCLQRVETLAYVLMCLWQSFALVDETGSFNELIRRGWRRKIVIRTSYQRHQMATRFS
ncbi:MAG: hypothetical protein ACXWT3_06360 [Methylococcaceae bacterium]